MRKRIFFATFFFALSCIASAQDQIQITNIGFHSLTKSKTFDFMMKEDMRNAFLKILDSIFVAEFRKKIIYNSNSRFNIDEPDAFELMNIPYQFRKKDLLGFDNRTEFLTLDISERPLNIDMHLAEIDSQYIKKLSLKRNICVYQLDLKIIKKDEKIDFNKHLYVLLARPDISNFIGFEHPFYNFSPSGFLQFIQNSLSILADSENGSELIQITALPAFVSDNFIQNKLEGKNKIPTKYNKGIVQFTNKELQAIRFLEPGFEAIKIKGKKITNITENLKQAILNEKPRDFILLWEEGRDVYANRNFKVNVVATLSTEPENLDSDIAINKKTGLPLDFLKGDFHNLIIDKDTIARFSINTKFFDSSRKVFYNQLLNPINHNIYFNNKNNIASVNRYHFDINGTYRKTPFRILMSGLNGNSSIKEIYYNNQLICITQGRTYPETISFLDPETPSEISNALIWLSFCSFF